MIGGKDNLRILEGGFYELIEFWDRPGTPDSCFADQIELTTSDCDTVILTPEDDRIRLRPEKLHSR